MKLNFNYINKKQIKNYSSYLFLVLFTIILLFACEYSKYLNLNKNITVIYNKKKLELKVINNKKQKADYLSFADAYKFLDKKIFYDNISSKIIICTNNIVKFNIVENTKTVNFVPTKNNEDYTYAYFNTLEKSNDIYINFDEIVLADNLRKVTDNKYNKRYLIKSTANIDSITTKNRVFVYNEFENIIDILPKEEKILVENIVDENLVLVSYLKDGVSRVGYVNKNDININIGKINQMKQQIQDGKAIAKTNSSKKELQPYIILDNLNNNYNKNYNYILSIFEITSSANDIEQIYTDNEINHIKQNVNSLIASINNRYNAANYDSDILHSIISSDKLKEANILKIKEKLKNIGLDTIVIDYRSVREKDETYLTEYILEMATYLKLNNIKTIVNITENSNIDINRLGNNVYKYNLIAYGKRTIKSNNSGEHSNIKYAADFIGNMQIKNIDSQKLILEIPLYSILWTEKQGKVIDANIYSLDAVNSFITKNNLTKEVDEKANQNYVELKKGSITYKMWIEDKSEIDKKIALATAKNIYGVCMYKSTYINEDIYNIIKDINK